MSAGNSWDALAWAAKQTTGGPGPKAVLLSIAKRVDESWSCYPGQETLALETEQSVRTVRDQLKKLEELGLIRRESRGKPGGGRTSDRYFLLVDGNPADPAGKGKPANLKGQTGNGLPVQTGKLLPGNSQGEQPDLEQPGRETVNGSRVRADDGGLFAVDAPSNGDAGEPEFDGPTFHEFWAAYPVKKAKQAACRAWERALFRVPLADRVDRARAIVDGAKRYAKDPDRTDKYTKHPATWLNGGCWEDEPTPVGSGRNPRGGGSRYRDSESYPDAPPWFDPAELEEDS